LKNNRSFRKSGNPFSKGFMAVEDIIIGRGKMKAIPPDKVKESN
jgi:hypothetical protein